MSYLGWGKCPQCGTRLHESKDTSTGNDFREYRCSQCHWSKTENCGIATWKAIADAQEQDQKAKTATETAAFEFKDEMCRALGRSKMPLPVPLDQLPQVMTSGAFSLEALHEALIAFVLQNPQAEAHLIPALCVVSYHLGKNKTHEEEDLEEGIRHLREAQYQAKRWASPPADLARGIHWHLGKAYIIAGEYQTAVFHFEKIVRLLGENEVIPEVWMALAGLADAMGDPQEVGRYVRDYVARIERLYPDRVKQLLGYAWKSPVCRASASIQRELAHCRPDLEAIHKHLTAGL